MQKLAEMGEMESMDAWRLGSHHGEDEETDELKRLAADLTERMPRQAEWAEMAIHTSLQEHWGDDPEALWREQLCVEHEAE